jgi:hypothetical protein
LVVRSVASWLRIGIIRVIAIVRRLVIKEWLFVRDDWVTISILIRHSV